MPTGEVKRVTWVKPPEGCYEVNYDVALFKDG